MCSVFIESLKIETCSYNVGISYCYLIAFSSMSHNNSNKHEFIIVDS